MKKVMLILMLLAMLTGCNETQQVPTNTKPLNSHLLATPQNWIDAYGDTLETQLVYNAVAGRNNDKILQGAIIETAKVIKNVHATDPNEILWRESVDERLDDLERDMVFYTKQGNADETKGCKTEEK